MAILLTRSTHNPSFRDVYYTLGRGDGPEGCQLIL